MDFHKLAKRRRVDHKKVEHSMESNAMVGFGWRPKTALRRRLQSEPGGFHFVVYSYCRGPADNLTGVRTIKKLRAIP